MSAKIVYPDRLALPVPRSFSGTVRLPGSKSLSNRALLIAALAEGETRLHHLLESDDVLHMRNALRALGVGVELSEDGTEAVVRGAGGPFRAAAADLFLGNAGTAMRPLTAALCLGQGEFRLHGEPRMAERPIKDLAESLQNLGARISYEQNEGFPPLRIVANGLRGGRVTIRGNVSSQFLTALLMAGPYCQEPLHIVMDGELISKPYIRITLAEMKRFGIEVENLDFTEFRVPQGIYQAPGDLEVEGDASAASYFLAGAAIAGGPVRVLGAGSDSVQGDVRFVEVLRQMGAVVRMGPDWMECERGELHGVDLDLNHIPDAAMTVAPLALFAQGTTRIRNIGSWRVKETDRIAAMACELRKLGATVEEGADFLSITPPERLLPAEIATYEDHRMAMCFSLVALGGGQVTLLDPACVRKTFPGYFGEFSRLCNL